MNKIEFLYVIIDNIEMCNRKYKKYKKYRKYRKYIMYNRIKKGYLYLRNNKWCILENVIKIGITQDPNNRNTTYITGEPEGGEYIKIFEIELSKMKILDKCFKEYFNEYNIYKKGGGTEFYNNDIENLIEPYLQKINITYKILSEEEINELNRINKYKKIKKIYKIQNINKPYIWNERKYQTDIINFSKKELSSRNKLYIELPTGGGKSYIVYNLFEHLKSNFIIIVSPRKIVNSQNISQKYLQILKDNYSIFNYSIDNNFDEYLKSSTKKIVICCTQSISKIYKMILLHNINNITIWFDEAHWGIEKKFAILNNDINSQFWLLFNKHIKYSIFTSASPNKEIISKNENIFGKLYSPIKVKELIDLNWLTSIKTYVYSENKKSVDTLNYIITDFNKTETKRNYGFSFHSKQKKAFKLFYKHYILYKNNETHIKPFLLVSYTFKIKQEILLDYEYRDIKTYENTNHSIGYVVAKYSMGYDFNKIDYIHFSDPKLSIQDIIQCIGRGIRPDELGKNGSNKNKILVISLPVYIDNIDNKYETIIEVLKYLLYDIKISFEEIEFKRYTSNPNPNPILEENENEELKNNVKSILLNLLELESKRNALGTTYEKAKKIISDKNIKSKESYYELCESDNRLSKEPETIFKGQFTNWIEYLSIKRVYYDLETCKKKVCEYLLKYPDIKKHYLDLSIASNLLSKLDSSFPPIGLWVEYYNVNDLSEIINITINRKKICPDI